MNSNEALTLDGSDSEDPDNDDSPASFRWSCEDSNKKPCYNYNDSSRWEGSTDQISTVNVKDLLAPDVTKET